jgi:2-polyprenyl-6-methoxyphenol hydroxylase-like FAD-dependent oxidoreductase
MWYRDLDARLFGLGVQRGALFALLDAAWTQQRTLHVGRRIVAIDPDTGVVQDEAGHSHGAFDLIIVADGAASRLRTTIASPAFDRPIRGARTGAWCPRAIGPSPTNCGNATSARVAWSACSRSGRGRAMRRRA